MISVVLFWFFLKSLFCVIWSWVELRCIYSFMLCLDLGLVERLVDVKKTCWVEWLRRKERKMIEWFCGKRFKNDVFFIGSFPFLTKFPLFHQHPFSPSKELLLFLPWVPLQIWDPNKALGILDSCRWGYVTWTWNSIFFVLKFKGSFRADLYRIFMRRLRICTPLFRKFWSLETSIGRCSVNAALYFPLDGIIGWEKREWIRVSHQVTHLDCGD